MIDNKNRPTIGTARIREFSFWMMNAPVTVKHQTLCPYHCHCKGSLLAAEFGEPTYYKVDTRQT